jgi:hypothetical protein
MFNAANPSNALGYVRSTRLGTGVGGGQPINFDIAGQPFAFQPQAWMAGFAPS